MAPELLGLDGLGEDAGRVTRASDVYALAMVCWEASKQHNDPFS